MHQQDGFELLNERLSRRLTSDTKADRLADNYAGLLECITDYNAGYEYYIKLNRYERKDTPMYVDSVLPLCPVCGASFDYHRYQFCGRCGQRLECEPDGNT